MTFAEFNNKVERLIESKEIPALGAILIEKSGKQSYNEAFGTINVNVEHAPPFTNDTQLLLFSCTKLIVAIAALHLIEQGKLSLDDAVSKHFPQISQLKIANEFDSDGQPITSESKKEMKIIHLFTHSAGLPYDLFAGDEFMRAYRISKGQAPGEALNPSDEWQYLDLFLDFEPGTRCRYGQNYDILGFVVESISGLPIEDYIIKNIAEPLGMKNTGPLFTSDSRMNIHAKSPDGLIAVPSAAPAPTCWKRGGGHFLISSLSDYSQVLLTLLNDGTHPPTGHNLLKPETVKELLFEDQLPSLGIESNGFGKFGNSPNPGISAAGDIFNHLSLSDVNRGVSCGLGINKSSKPGYRSEGSGAWAGLANVYYWIDRENGKAGIIGSSLLPFMDPNITDLFENFERLSYAS